MGSSRVLTRPKSTAERWFDIKNLVHQKLLNSLDTDTLKAINKERVRGEIGLTVEKLVLDDQAHMIWVFWWHRIVPYQSYVKGFKIAPTHFINQDLATIWLDK